MPTPVLPLMLQPDTESGCGPSVHTRPSPALPEISHELMFTAPLDVWTCTASPPEPSTRAPNEKLLPTGVEVLFVAICTAGQPGAPKRSTTARSTKLDPPGPPESVRYQEGQLPVC